MKILRLVTVIFCYLLTSSAYGQTIRPPRDPYFLSKGTWQQKHDDQWAIKKAGFTGDADSAWKLVKTDAAPVIIAVIDTGLDWNHLDISWNNIWINPGEIKDNGIDDDHNGYIDDVIGWNFYKHDNKPWDNDGHGTFVTGIIAATWNNGAGIAGINPKAKIMVLKGLNNFGHSRASYLSKAIIYATDNGARVINMSVGGKGLTKIITAAIAYANSKGVVIVAAAGNEAVDVNDFGFAALDGVITVASTNLQDKRAVFSNWGAKIDISAPGLDILSLRARRTDFMSGIPGMTYSPRSAYVGEDNRYYRASGTSFSAPIVSAVASLLLNNRPELTNREVRRILLNSARDIDTPGIDQYTGYGLVDARAALVADRDYFISSAISGVEVKQGQKGLLVNIIGTANADKFKKAVIEIGAGENPASWKKITDGITKPVIQQSVGAIPASALAGSTVWIIRLTTTHRNGKTRQARFRLSLG